MVHKWDKETLEEKREENGKWRKTRKERRERRLRERDSESHGTIDCRVPWGKSILQGHPVLFLRKFALFLLASSSPLSTSVRVLNTRRKRKTARRPRHWLRSLYFVSTQTFLHRVSPGSSYFLLHINPLMHQEQYFLLIKIFNCILFSK